MNDTVTRGPHNPAWDTADYSDAADPFSLFGDWFSEAEKREPNDANAMALATVDPDGLPNVRMVLLKGFDENRLRVLHQLRERKRA